MYVRFVLFDPLTAGDDWTGPRLRVPDGMTTTPPEQDPDIVPSGDPTPIPTPDPPPGPGEDPGAAPEQPEIEPPEDPRP